MVYVRRNHPPQYPKLKISNLTSSVLYLGIKTSKFSGIYLAPKGQTGDNVTLVGVDFTDKPTVRVLTQLVEDQKIMVDLVEGFYQAYSLAVPTSTTSASTTSGG